MNTKTLLVLASLAVLPAGLARADVNDNLTVDIRLGRGAGRAPPRSRKLGTATLEPATAFMKEGFKGLRQGGLFASRDCEEQRRATLRAIGAQGSV